MNCGETMQTWYPTSYPLSRTWCFSGVMPIYAMLTPTWMLLGYAIFAPPQSQVETSFERSLMQEYEQHLIGLGVKPGSKKEQRFHPYKKNKRDRGGRQQAPQGVYYQPMPAPQYMVQQPFFQSSPQCGRRGCGGRRGRGRRGSTGGNKQQQPQTPSGNAQTYPGYPA